VNIRARTALLSTGLNLLLTVLKFSLFTLTGSLAILAEAWHSFTDIGTSAVVLFAVTRGGRTAGDGEGPTSDTEADGAPAGGAARGLLGLLRRATAEQRAAMGIGVLLTMVALGLLRKVVVHERELIEKPLLSGVAFLVFAAGSYFVFRFETAVGKEQRSVGLVSDGLHSRADMIGALLTGIAMILYSAGIDVDRPVAVLISLFVLSFGVETLVNTAVSISKPGAGEVWRLRTLEVVQALVDRERLADALRWIESTTSVSLLPRLRGCRNGLRTLRWPAALVIGLGYLGTSVYTVGLSEEAIVMRFGRPVLRSKAIGPGVHLMLPWPIDRVTRIDTRSVRQLSLGNISDRSAFALIWTQEHGSGAPYLTGDNNFFFPYLVIHYRVRDPLAYLVLHSNADDLLENVASDRISILFASRSFDDIVCAQRAPFERAIHDQVQSTLDDLNSGLEVLGVFFKDVHPPMSIANTFEHVIAARQEKEELISTARGYRNQRIPEVRGEAARAAESSQSYVLERVLHAEGDARRFLSRRVTGSRSRALTKRRLHLEVMSSAMAQAKMAVVDPKAGTPTMFLDGEMAPEPRAELPEFLIHGQAQDERE